MISPLCQAAAFPAGQSRKLTQRFWPSTILEPNLCECSVTGEAATMVKAGDRPQQLLNGADEGSQYFTF